MAGQQLGKRAIQELAEDTPPIGSKGGEHPLSSLFFPVGVIVTFCSHACFTAATFLDYLQTPVESLHGAATFQIIITGTLLISSIASGMISNPLHM